MSSISNGTSSGMKIESIGYSEQERWMKALEGIEHDIYHRPEYSALEARRTESSAELLVVADGERRLLAPYLFRPCAEVDPEDPFAAETFDAVSPYGYPGILVSDSGMASPGFLKEAFEGLRFGLAGRGLCSAFFRMHPILNRRLPETAPAGLLTNQGDTVSIDLTLSKEEMWSETRSGHRRAISKCLKSGMTARMAPFEEHIEEFVAIYNETMERVGAANRYYSFDVAYFEEMRRTLGPMLQLCLVECEGETACVGLYTECCGVVQSALGGTRNKFVSLSPSILETDYARSWFAARGNKQLHLGGGVGTAEDTVFRFKAGFSKTRFQFFTVRLTLDDSRYQYLVDRRARKLGLSADELLQSEFFPAYRAV